LDSGLVVIDCDIAALESMKYLELHQNIVYYIEHLKAGTGIKELVLDYCKVDTPRGRKSILSSKSC